tara:strand:+ start:1573 stop:2457 length:885 start_codon:yes stop_codon:yes gene_type:complete
MKINAVTYHYVRSQSKEFPYYDFLDKKIFREQIKFFKNKNVITSFESYNQETENYMLTFDDGLIDHLWVANELSKNGMRGIFFIPTLPIKKNKILDVHKVHIILGKISPDEVFKHFETYIKKKKYYNFTNKDEKLFFEAAYSKYDESNTKKKFKKIMNYYSNLETRSEILDYLMRKFDIRTCSENYYLNEEQIKRLSKLGMIIGSHGFSHNLFSRMNPKLQEEEIKKSKETLEKITGKECLHFCYPYGSKLSYNIDTIKILKKLDFKYAFTVEHRSIENHDIQKKPYELPRLSK